MSTASVSRGPKAESAFAGTASLDDSGLATPILSGVLKGDQRVVNPGSEDGSSDEYNVYTNWHAANRWRYESGAGVEFHVKDCKCLCGGFLKVPTVIPIRNFEGTDMVNVTGRAYWLCQAGTGRSIQRGAFEQGVARIKNSLSEKNHTAARDSCQKKLDLAATGRTLLGIGCSDSDSSPSDGENEGGEREENRQQKKLLKVELKKIQDIEFNGVIFKAFAVGKALYIEVRADVFRVVVAACLDATADSMKRSVGDAVPAELDVEERDGNHSGRKIRFNPKKKTVRGYILVRNG